MIPNEGHERNNEGRKALNTIEIDELGELPEVEGCDGRDCPELQLMINIARNSPSRLVQFMCVKRHQLVRITFKGKRGEAQ